MTNENGFFNISVQFMCGFVTSLNNIFGKVVTNFSLSMQYDTIIFICIANIQYN